MNDGTLQPAAPSLVRIDLGSGQNKREGFTGMDRMPGSDIVHDLLDLPWPFADSSVDELHCSHVMEHFHGEDQIKIIDEAYRVLKYSEPEGASAKGTLTVIVPAWNSHRQWQDPTHKAPFPEQKALYFNKNWREANKLAHYPIQSDFDFQSSYQIVAPAVPGIQDYTARSREVQLTALYYYNNVCGDVYIVFRKNKR